MKSFKGEDLEKVFVSFSGIQGDRVYGFVDPSKTGNFPWVSARQVPEMILFEPRFLTPPLDSVTFPDLNVYQIEVTAPDGSKHRMDDPAFLKYLQNRWGRPLILRFSEKGMQDSRPISIFAMPTLAQLESEVGSPTDLRRFRSNFYVEWDSGKAFYEEDLLGQTLQIGEKLRVMITKKDSRCVIINLDPDTSKSTPEVLKTVGKLHGGQIGVYAVTIQEGVAAAGDPISLVDPS